MVADKIYLSSIAKVLGARGGAATKGIKTAKKRKSSRLNVAKARASKALKRLQLQTEQPHP